MTTFGQVGLEIRTHTALHVVKGAVQKIIGAKMSNGAFVSGKNGRLSVELGKKPTENEVARVEEEANACVDKGLDISVEELDRKEAETRFGNEMYDSFPIPEGVNRLSVVVIDDNSNGNYRWNVNACNKRHTLKTSDVGKIKIDHWRYRDAKKTLEISFTVEESNSDNTDV